MREEIIKFTEKYGPYLEDIRKKILIFCYFFLFCFLVGFIFSGSLVRFVFQRLSDNNIKVFVESPFQFFTVTFHLSLFFAIFATFPVALYFICSFLRSALKKRERVLMTKLAFASVLLFIFGFVFGLGIMYHAMIYLAGFNAKMGLTNMWNMGILASQVLLASALLGLYFQYPLILTILIRLGLLSVDTLRKKRRVMTLLTVGVVSLLPPPEIFATIGMLIPILLMYEITIIVNRKYGTKLVEVPAHKKIIN